jgi:hypothetical protein
MAWQSLGTSRQPPTSPETHKYGASVDHHDAWPMPPNNPYPASAPFDSNVAHHQHFSEFFSDLLGADPAELFHSPNTYNTVALR